MAQHGFLSRNPRFAVRLELTGCRLSKDRCNELNPTLIYMCHNTCSRIYSTDQRISFSRCTHAALVTQQTALQVIARQHSRTTKTAKLLAAPPYRAGSTAGVAGGRHLGRGAIGAESSVVGRGAEEVGCGEGVSPSPLGRGVRRPEGCSIFESKRRVLVHSGCISLSSAINREAM